MLLHPMNPTNLHQQLCIECVIVSLSSLGCNMQSMKYKLIGGHILAVNSILINGLQELVHKVVPDSVSNL